MPAAARRTEPAEADERCRAGARGAGVRAAGARAGEGVVSRRPRSNRAEEPEAEEPEFRDPEIEEEVAVPAMTDAAFDGGTDRGGLRDAASGGRSGGPGSLRRPRPGPGAVRSGVRASPRLDHRRGLARAPPAALGLAASLDPGILALLVAGLVWFRSRGPSSPESVAAAIARTATAAPESVADRGARARRGPDVLRARDRGADRRGGRADPTGADARRAAEKPARARSPIPAPAVAAGPPPAASASSRTRQYWLDRAARDEKRFGGSTKTVRDPARARLRGHLARGRVPARPRRQHVGR